jgi:hypothetical protein
LLVKIAIARTCLRGDKYDKYDVSQDVRQLVAGRSQTSDLDLLFAGLSVPNECMTVRCRRAGTKINVVGPLAAVLRTGFRSDVAGGAPGATAAMLSACFVAELGRASRCRWSGRAASGCALLIPAPKPTKAASMAALARSSRPRYSRITPAIFESSWIQDPMPQ